VDNILWKTSQRTIWNIIFFPHKLWLTLCGRLPCTDTAERSRIGDRTRPDTRYPYPYPYPGNIDEILSLLHKCKDAAKLQACRPICLLNVSLEFSLS
jgi:hypothetical protein